MSIYKKLFEDPQGKKITTIVGSIMIVVAMAGIFIHEAEAYRSKVVKLEDLNIDIGGKEITIRWETATMDVITETSYLSEGASEAHPWDNENYILSDIIFELTWDDDSYPIVGAPNDEFRLSVGGPDVNAGEDSSTTEAISLPYGPEDLNTQPEVFDVSVNPDASDDDINTKIEEEYNDWLEEQLEDGNVKGIGTWNSEVTAVNCEGRYVGRIAFPDNGNNYNIRVTINYWIYTWSIEDSE